MQQCNKPPHTRHCLICRWSWNWRCSNGRIINCCCNNKHSESPFILFKANFDIRNKKTVKQWNRTTLVVVCSNSKMLLTSISRCVDFCSWCAVQQQLHGIMRYNRRTRSEKCSLGWICWWMQWRPHNWHCYTANRITSDMQLTNMSPSSWVFMTVLVMCCKIW